MASRIGGEGECSALASAIVRWLTLQRRGIGFDRQRDTRNPKVETLFDYTGEVISLGDLDTVMRIRGLRIRRHGRSFVNVAARRARSVSRRGDIEI